MLHCIDRKQASDSKTMEREPASTKKLQQQWSGNPHPENTAGPNASKFVVLSVFCKSHWQGGVKFMFLKIYLFNQIMNICENYENLWKLAKFMKCVRFCDFFWKFHKCNWTKRGQIWRFGALGTFSCVFSGFQRIKDMPSVAPGRNKFMLAWVLRFALGTRFPLKEVLKVNGVLDAPRAHAPK